MKLHPLLPVLLALAASGCSALSGNNSADAGPLPIVQSISFPPTASIGSDGNYDFVGHISFTSPTSPVVSIHVVSQALQYDNQIAIEPVATVTNGAVPITFPPGIASGTEADYAISVIDEAGAESLALSGTVTLE
jgi:hypothetical protein